MYIKLSEDRKTETRKYSEYVHKAPVKSFVDGTNIYMSDHFHCPKCNKEYKAPMIYKFIDCECGLSMVFTYDSDLLEVMIECTLLADSVVVLKTNTDEWNKFNKDKIEFESLVACGVNPMDILAARNADKQNDEDFNIIAYNTKIKDHGARSYGTWICNVIPEKECKYYKRMESKDHCFYREEGSRLCNNPSIRTDGNGMELNDNTVDLYKKQDEESRTQVRGEGNKCNIVLFSDGSGHELGTCLEIKDNRTSELSTCKYFKSKNENGDECFFYKYRDLCTNKEANLSCLSKLFNKINNIIKKITEEE
jgi:hypothetical protein